MNLNYSHVAHLSRKGGAIAAVCLLIVFPYNGINHIESNVNNVLYVGGDGPNNYTRIQDAIDEASDGDTIIVYPGYYDENITIDKSLSIMGIETPEKTPEKPVINGAIVSHKSIEFKTFTIEAMSVFDQPGNLIENISGLYTGFISHIHVVNSSRNDIKNCDNAGIYLENSKDNNLVNIYGPEVGIFLDNSTDNNLRNINLDFLALWYSDATCLHGNITYIALHGSSINIMNTIAEVTAYFSHLYMSNIQVRNAAEMGIVMANCTAKITNSTIEKNDWGLYATGSSLEIQNSTITENNIGMVITVSECIIRYCNILGNKDFGILTVNSTVDARYNYWGSMFGPSYLFKFRGDLIWVFCDIKHFPWLLFPAN